jgi:GT2 family glycosyltransferase
MLAVVILNWNDAPATVSCVTSVKSWTELKPCICVVDNDSQDDSVRRIAAAHPDIVLVRSESNRGYGGGNNLGLMAVLETQVKWVLLLNNDAYIEQEGVRQLCETLVGEPHLGIVGPPLYEKSSGALLSAGGRDISRHVLSHRRPKAVDPGVTLVDYVPGTVALVRREVWDGVGLFDEAYFFSGEMADLCERAQQHGFSCAIDGRAHAWHDLHRSADLRRALHAYYILRNRFLFVRKHRRDRRALLWLFWVAYGSLLIISGILRRNREQARAVGLGLVDGISGTYGGQNARVLKGE